ncbi:arginyltransferase [Neomegalonema perideroedes]|uniref:arginyltransferase n=1 Tax=Neomegalonema perideroedes TaxID=217219 RepID=UPI00039DFAB7|nr:arginyltransferase [Neomegalonema perideroedes]
MTQHFGLPRPRFYVTEPQPCPYLEGRLERKVFTPLHGEAAAMLNDELSLNGFRRSQKVAYKPQCAGCDACVSVRVPVARFTPTRTQRKILNRNSGFLRESRPPRATEEQYELFRRYLQARHHDGAMADMDDYEFAAMIEDTTVRSRMVEYRDPEDGSLLAACLTDGLADGLSMVYSFYDPDRPEASLGAYAVLDHIRLAGEEGLPHVYLGYWIEGSRKMSYKTAYQPLELLTPFGWRPWTPPAAP